MQDHGKNVKNQVFASTKIDPLRSEILFSKKKEWAKGVKDCLKKLQKIICFDIGPLSNWEAKSLVLYHNASS